MCTGEESRFDAPAVFFCVLTKVRGRVITDLVRVCDRERLAVRRDRERRREKGRVTHAREKVCVCVYVCGKTAPLQS